MTSYKLLKIHINFAIRFLSFIGINKQVLHATAVQLLYKGKWIWNWKEVFKLSNFKALLVLKHNCDVQLYNEAYVTI